MKYITHTLVSIFLFVFGLFVLAESQINTVQLFAKKNEVVSVKLSPSGKYLGIRRIRNDESRLVVLDIKSKKILSHIEFKSKAQVGSFQWANDERIVIKILSKKNDLDGFVYYGELYSFDITKNKGNMIFGSRMRAITTNNLKEKLIIEKHRAMAASWANIISIFPKDRKRILIEARPYSKKKNKTPRLYLLNISNGDLSFYTEAPASHAKYIADQNGDLAFATTTNINDKKIVFEFQLDTKTWNPVKKLSYSDWFTPLQYDSNKRILTYLDSYEKDKRSLLRLDVASNKISTIFEDQKRDIYGVHLNERINKVLGVETNTGYPEYHLVESKKENNGVYNELLQVFRGYKIADINSNLDESLYSIHISSDVEPGAWYLYDKSSKKVQFIAKKYEHLDRTKLSHTEPFSFKSRDNEVISGYLTLPINNNNKKYPAVLLIRKYLAGQSDWSFGNTRQFLSSLGYAVIEINNRGSTVYGRKFAELANLHWGDTVQFDLIDGVNYLSKQGLIDGDKVCNMGEFIGGYSAIQLSVLDNKLFKCSIAKSAFYDLSLFKEEWLDLELPWGKSSFKNSFGDSKALLNAFSPIQHLDQLKAPLLIVHGEREKQIPIEQPENLIDRLDELDKPYTWLELENESEFVFKEESRRDYLQAVKSFLYKYNPVFARNMGVK